jgi:hypothetical protein
MRACDGAIEPLKRIVYKASVRRGRLSRSTSIAMVPLSLVGLAVVLLFLMAGPAAARPSGRLLTASDAKAALRAVGATSTFTASSPAASSQSWHETSVFVTGGDISVQQLSVNVFSSANAARTFVAKLPPPPKSVIQAAFGRPGWYLPDKVVCNAFVGSNLILSRAVVPLVQASENRVAADLSGRCAGTVSVAVVGRGDSHAARLVPAGTDVVRARSLLLTKADLPGGFRTHDPNASAQLPQFTGECGNLVDPDLSALIETASVSSPVLQDIDSGAQFLPTAAVFASPAQAARAQALQTGSDDVTCGVALTKKRLETVPYTITGQTSRLIARTIDGVEVRGREVIVTMSVDPNNFKLQVEVSFIFLRHGRALSELRTSIPWGSAAGNTNPATTWDDAVNAAARRVAHSGF